MKEDDLVPVENKPGFFRDTASGAIINTDVNGATRARNARLKAMQREEEIEQMKEEMHEIKSLLKQLLERL